MASLVLLLSELLTHENTDYLTSFSASSSSTSSVNSCAVMASKGVQSISSKRDLRSFDNYFDKEEEFEELPRICVDMVWP